MNSALQQRKEHFARLCSGFEHRKLDDLIAAVRINPLLFERLKLASRLYALASAMRIPELKVNPEMNDQSLLDLMASHLDQIQNMTPNGMLVPKRDFILEYNLFTAAFADIISRLNIDDFILEWVAPLTLRFKEARPAQQKLDRSYASENMHAESWIPINTKKCITVFIPILGDIENNYVDLFSPPEDFEESWLDPVPSYREGQAIADKYRKTSFKPTAGELYLADTATMHATTRKAGALSRASIDVSFVYKDRTVSKRDPEPVFPTQRTLSLIGRQHLFVFHDRMDEYVKSEGGGASCLL